ncbi:unnamed protein product, partial [Leptidea sinapis]
MCRLFFYFVFALTTKASASKILAVFPTPVLSHQIFFRPFVQEWTRRGHEVTVITPIPVHPSGKDFENLREIDVQHVSYETVSDYFVDNNLGKRGHIIDQIYELNKLNCITVQAQLATQEVYALRTKEKTKFDVLVLEQCSRSAITYSHIFEVPVIQISSFGIWGVVDEAVGIPTHPLLYPNFMHQRLYDLSVMEKLSEIYKHCRIKRDLRNLAPIQIKKFQAILGIDIPSYDVLEENIDMLFLNVHPIWIDNQPLPTNVISIWGMHNNTQNDLPQELKTYLDSSKQGVIYLSLGTNAQWSQLPEALEQIFKQVFSQLEYNVLWKWDSDDLPETSENIRMSKWFPQKDILRHPNVKLFITQGGIHSMEEAIQAGVPLISIPMKVDQWYNGEKVNRHKIGIKLDMDSLDEEKLLKIIKEVLGDKSYKININRLRTLLNDQPQSAMDRVTWWTEYVLRHRGAKHLRSLAANMTWMEYYDVQLALFLILLTISLTIAVYNICIKSYSIIM